jgi:hypothetical protein
MVSLHTRYAHMKLSSVLCADMTALLDWYPGMWSFRAGDCLRWLTDLHQNEPENSNPSYPTAIVTAAQEAQVATALRTLMNNNGFSGTRIIAYDHNWNDAGGYPVQTVSISYGVHPG